MTLPRKGGRELDRIKLTDSTNFVRKSLILVVERNENKRVTLTSGRYSEACEHNLMLLYYETVQSFNDFENFALYRGTIETEKPDGQVVLFV